MEGATYNMILDQNIDQTNMEETMGLKSKELQENHRVHSKGELLAPSYSEEMIVLQIEVVGGRTSDFLEK